MNSILIHNKHRVDIKMSNDRSELGDLVLKPRRPKPRPQRRSSFNGQ